MKNLFYVLLTLIFLNGCSKNDEIQEIKVKKFEIDEAVIEEKEIKSNDDNKSFDSKNTSLQTIKSFEVKKHIGDSLIVRVYVADIFRSDKVAYLNFEKKFPKNLLTATIFADNFDLFNDLSKFNNKNVEIIGKILLYKNKPQIIITNPEQIKILE